MLYLLAAQNPEERRNSALVTPPQSFTNPQQPSGHTQANNRQHFALPQIPASAQPPPRQRQQRFAAISTFPPSYQEYIPQEYPMQDEWQDFEDEDFLEDPYDEYNGDGYAEERYEPENYQYYYYYYPVDGYPGYYNEYRVCAFQNQPNPVQQHPTAPAPPAKPQGSPPRDQQNRNSTNYQQGSQRNSVRNPNQFPNQNNQNNPRMSVQGDNPRNYDQYNHQQGNRGMDSPMGRDPFKDRARCPRCNRHFMYTPYPEYMRMDCIKYPVQSPAEQRARCDKCHLQHYTVNCRQDLPYREVYPNQRPDRSPPQHNPMFSNQNMNPNMGNTINNSPLQNMMGRDQRNPPNSGGQVPPSRSNYNRSQSNSWHSRDQHQGSRQNPNNQSDFQRNPRPQHHQAAMAVAPHTQFTNQE